MRRSCVPVALLFACTVGFGPKAADGSSPWLEVDAPGEGETSVRSAWIAIGGHGGDRRGMGHDVAIVVDVSESTLEDSGIDLDGDGAAGRTDSALVRWLENQAGDSRVVRRLRDDQDFDDTVLAAELEAARALIERLDPGRFRVALVAFAEDARVLAPLGSSREELTEALESLRLDLHLDTRGTNYHAAIETAHGLLRPRPDGRDGRLRSIVFLSDGAPTRPVRGGRAERYALSAALAAGREGIRLYAFAIGPEAEGGLAIMGRMAAWTSGRLETVPRPARIVARLRQLDLVGLAELAVVNETTGAEARALRIFPDGSFDGFVELAPGRNRLAFVARGRDGALHEVERWVRFEAPPGVASGPRGEPGPATAISEAATAEEALLEELRRRTAEIEVWADLEERRRQRKEVEIRAEERPATEPGRIPAR